MKRLAAIVLLAAFAAAAQAQDTQPQPLGQAPKLVCDETVHMFGEVSNDREVVHTFILRNEGNLDLEIASVRAACGCTVAQLSNKTVPPKGQAELKATFNLRGRSGRQRKSITVQSNDPLQPQILLYLDGTALPGFEVSPSAVMFGQVAPGESATRSVEFKSAAEPFNILKVETSTTQITAKVEALEPGRRYRVDVATVPPLHPGRLSANIRVTTDKATSPDYSIPVVALVVGHLSVVPQEIILSTLGGQPVNRYIVVRPGQSKSFQVTGVELPDPAMTSTITRLEDAASYRIEIGNIVAGEALNGQVVRIRTDLESMPELTVPFRVIPTGPQPPATP